MYDILTLNKISKTGLERFTDEYQYGDAVENPQGIMVRSASMHEMEMPQSLLAIARAGVGVNNIPIDGKGHCGFQHSRRQCQCGQGAGFGGAADLLP